MDRQGHEGVVFFVGAEVEHTPAFGQRTLFVVGCEEHEEIVRTAEKNNCTHIYMGANQSFEPSDDWDILLNELLHNWDGYLTLDYDIIHNDWVLEGGFNEHEQFISMISVKLPYISQLNYNACIKIDDTDFANTNPGVWTHRVHDLKNTSVFTPWSKYTQDKTLESEQQFQLRIKGLRHEDYMRERENRDNGKEVL